MPLSTRVSLQMLPDKFLRATCDVHGDIGVTLSIPEGGLRNGAYD